MRGFTVLAPAMLALGLGACDSVRGWQEPIESTRMVVDKYTIQDKATPIELLTKYYNERNPGQGRKDFRDEYIDKRLIAINARFYHFTKEMREGKVGTGLGGDVVKLLLGAVGAVTGSAFTKSALNAASTAVTGATASFDKHVFYEAALPALIAQMNASRDTIILAIRNGQRKSAEEFSLADGLEHLQRLEQAGSIEDAIAKITAKATAAADAAKKDVLNADGASDADKKYLESAEGKQYWDTVARRADTAGIAKIRAFAAKAPDSVNNAEADKKAADEIKRLVTPTDPQYRGIVKDRIRLAKRKIELETWDKALR